MDFTNGSMECQLRWDAQVQDEWATKALWQYLFNKFIFKEKEWAIVSEHPPRPTQSLRRIDIVGKNAKLVLFYMEAKRGKATEADVIDAETQVFQACHEHFLYGGGERDSMWVMTCFGPCIRIWTYTRGDDNIVPYFPEHDEGKSSYVDIAYEPRLLDIFDFMKKNVVPPQNYPESRPLDYQDVGSSSYTDTGVANDPLMVDTSFTFVLAEPTKADGSVPVTLPDGNRARLWAEDWLPAQVYYQGAYHPCLAQKGRASGKWYWAWKR